MREQIIAAVVAAIVSGVGAAIAWFTGVEGRITAIETDVRTIKCVIAPTRPECLRWEDR